MRFFFLVSLLFTLAFGYSQSLPIDFEADSLSFVFVDFDGGFATVEDNPQIDTTNTSTKVGQIIRNGGQIYAGSSIQLSENLDFTTMNSISMKVYTTAPVGTVVKFKLEGNGTTERDVLTTVSNAWEDLTWDFTGEPTNFNKLVFMFDFGNIGDGTATSTFYFDNISQNFGGIQIDLPVYFEGTEVNYTVSDFGGNVSSLVVDPTDPNNMVIKSIKTDQAALWAGTTIGTPAGFASNIPLTLTDPYMQAKVWSPEIGTPIRLKVEDSKDPTHTCETQTNTTQVGWEYITFDFSNQAEGTESLEVGLSMGWTYNMASIFFNFGTEGAVTGEQTYYFDDVIFGAMITGTDNIRIKNLSVTPNPSNTDWTIQSDTDIINSIQIFDVKGKLILTQSPKAHSTLVNASNLTPGIYVAKVSSKTGTSVVRLVKK